MPRRADAGGIDATIDFQLGHPRFDVGSGPGVAGFLCMERPHGRFSRAILLDSPVDVPQAAAHLAAGVLTITLPRLKDRRGREAVIAVTREEEGRQ